MKNHKGIAVLVTFSLIIGMFSMVPQTANGAEASGVKITDHAPDVGKVDTEGMNIIDLGTDFSEGDTNREITSESIVDTSNGRLDLPRNLAGKETGELCCGFVSGLALWECRHSGGH